VNDAHVVNAEHAAAAFVKRRVAVHDDIAACPRQNDALEPKPDAVQVPDPILIDRILEFEKL